MSSELSSFHRLRRLPPYVFAEVNALKHKMRQDGRDIIDFGMGNPDSPTPPHIVEKLKEAASNPDTHGYGVSRGILGLRKAQAAYYERRFGITLDPEKEVIATIGSKEGLANLAQAITRPGDVVLVPNPSYPIHPYGFVIAEAAVRYIPKTGGIPFMEALDRAVRHSNPTPVALVLNYPCNPTAETTTLDFYEEVIDYCKFHGIYVLSDLAYCEIYFDDNPPPSILQVKGAKDIAVEFTTLSKTYSMAGWRVGFAVGNPMLIAALAKIKSYLDYGQFMPLQIAATHALNGPQDCVLQVRNLYKERRDVLVSGLHEAGWMVEVPKASMFVWGEIPPQFKDMGSLAFSKMLIEKAEVAVAPGIGFGEYGDTHVRIGLVENTQRIRQAVRNIKKALKS
jgi:alanine-synthesizing transaminase